jgi:mannose-6-phosphate isomerase
LTPFEAFIGFRQLKEIKENLKTYPELKAVVGQAGDQFLSHAEGSNIEADKNALKALFKALMESDQQVINQQIQALEVRVEISPNKEKVGSLDELLYRLNKQYPLDVGTFCALLLNYVKLSPGEGIFLAANEPHAYISGGML